MKKEKSNTTISIPERYKLLIQARNFHYDNYNKWMSYFYLIIGALFVGLTQIDFNKEPELFWIVLILGCIVSLFWYWSNKGYYYWIINFINLVSYYEKKLLHFNEKERIYFVFSNKNEQNNYTSPIKGANISTSKVSILLSFIITTFWFTVLISKTIIKFSSTDAWYIYVISYIISVIIVIVITKYFPRKWLKSNITHFPDLKIDISEEWKGDKKTTKS